IFNSEGVRSIYLPKGVWVDFWNKMEYKGERWIRYVAPLDIIPVFVKGDSIIPFGPVRQYIEVDPKPERDLTLDIYLYRAASFTLIDDYEKVEFRAEREANKITLYISKSNKEYTVLFNNVDKPREVLLNSKVLSSEDWSYEESIRGVKARFKADGYIKLELLY
ncbi:hypothetical protein DRO64_03805, partial [Candidatus Bathyarchaeota archaeon]